MNHISFDKQQTAVINTLGKNTMVSASAGAGKTTVLIARLMKRILSDGIQVNQICAMTFTSKAANEMKKRLAEALNKAYQEERSDFLYQQLQQLETAQISTIHSFCLQIIKEFGYLIGFDPQRTNNILDDDSLMLLKQQAFEEVLEEQLTNNQNAIALLASLFSEKPLSLASLQKAVQDLYNQSQIHLDSQTWLTKLGDIYDARSLLELPVAYQEVYQRGMMLYIEQIIEATAQLKMAFYSLSNETIEKGGKVSDQINNFFDQAQRFKEVLKTLDLHLIKEEGIKLFNNTISTISKEEAFNNQRMLWKKVIESFPLEILYYDDDFTEVNPQQKQLVSTLSQLTLAYGDRFNDLKESHRAIDFNDIEHFAYLILVHPSETAKTALQYRYSDILVDEFQDSNFFQEEIVNLISYHNNIFRVGDVKQSIYGFRHAKPDIMRQLMTKEDDNHEVHYLTKNYRSKEKIVSFNNELFSKLMNIDGFKDEYSDQDRVQTGSPAQIKDNPPVVFDLVSSSDGDLKDPEIVSLYIAQDIQRKINEGFKYKDVCILLRAHSRKKDLEKAFIQLGIPYYFDSQEGFKHASSVQDVLHMIQFLQQPNQDFYCGYVLLSDFSDYDENMLTQLRLQTPKTSLYQNLESFDSSLYLQLELLRNTFNRSSLSQGLQAIYGFNDYYFKRVSLDQKTNLDLLFEKVVHYENSDHQGWLGFIEQMAFMLDDDKSSNAVAIDEDEDCVRVLTIHQSKGLQFPLIYYYSTAKVSLPELREAIVIDGDLGVSLNHVDFDKRYQRNHLIRQILEWNSRFSEVEESIRLLYVALTRAQKQLCVVATMPKRSVEGDVSAYTLFSAEGHTLSIIRTLLAIDPTLFSYNTPELELLEEVTTKQTINQGFDLPTLDIKPSIVSSPSYKQKLNFTELLSSTEKGSLLHKILEQWPAHHFDISYLDQFNLAYEQQMQLLHYANDDFTKHLHSQSFDYELGYIARDEVGIMDFVGIIDDRVYLVDFKTDRIDDASILVSRYRAQLLRYYEALTYSYPDKTIEVFLYSFNLNKFIHVEMN